MHTRKHDLTAHMYVYTCTYIYIHVYICIYIYMYLHVYVCIHTSMILMHTFSPPQVIQNVRH